MTYLRLSLQGGRIGARIASYGGVRLVPCARRREERLWEGEGCTGEGHTIAEWRRDSP